MSGVNLDPIVGQKLNRLKRRRNSLLIARGVSVGIVTFLLCVALIAFADWYWLLSDSVRWTMTGASCLLVIAAVWFASIRRLALSPSDEEAALIIERTEPELRENLRSAIELAVDNPKHVHDSLTFRSLLQGKVAGQIGSVEISNVLPIRLVAKWILAASIIAAASAALFFAGDSRIRKLVARAIMPGANIARISRIKVEVLQPTPNSQLLAENETVAVIVKISGGTVSDVILETVTSTDGSTKFSMNGRTESEFAANILLKNESLRYRILAGDAVTKWFTIDTRPRPRVTAFSKTYQFPEYSQLPELSVTESHGDLFALQGTEVLLSLELDQTVSKAELRIAPNQTDEMSVVQLQKSGNQWQTTLPIDQPAIYKIRLVSTETGFENIFSPKFEIRPQPDLVPSVGFVDQPEANLLLPPNDILSLKAIAEDDLPLDKLDQQFSINGEEWESVELELQPLEGSSGRKAVSNWKWDLLPFALKSGDQVLTKLVATDRKGNIGESIPLRVIIAAKNFDPNRHAKMIRKLQLYDDIASFSKLVAEQKESSYAAIENLRNQKRSADEQKIDRNSLLEITGTQRERASALLQKIVAVEREMPAGADAYDLELTGRVLARIEHDNGNRIPFILATLLQPSSNVKLDTAQTKQRLDELKQSVDQTSDHAKTLSYHFQALVSHNLLAAMTHDLHAIYEQQEVVQKKSTQSWDRMMRQQTVAIRQVEAVEKLIANHLPRMSDHLKGQLQNFSNWLGEQRTRIVDASESEQTFDELRRFSNDFTKQLVHRKRLENLDGNLPNRLSGARRDFENRAGRLSELLFRIAHATREEIRFEGMAKQSKDSVASTKHQIESRRFKAELEEWRGKSLEQFRARRQLLQSRKDADIRFASDNGLTIRAANWLLSQHQEHVETNSNFPQNFNEIATAFRVLECGHHVVQTKTIVELLVNRERWDSQSLDAATDHPRQWDVINQGLELSAVSIRTGGLDKKLADQLDSLRWGKAVRDANQKLTERRWKRDQHLSAGNDLVEIRGILANVNEALQPAMTAARLKIAEFAPSIPEMATNAAQQIRKLEHQTTSIADSIEERSGDQVNGKLDEETQSKDQRLQIAQLKSKQRQINGRLEDLYEALVDDANSQDLLDNQQRERARDADDSIAMINEPAKQMNRSLRNAEVAADVVKKANQLSNAVEHQEKTASALDFVAKHFDDLKNSLDVAESREQLRQFETEAGLQQKLDSQFSESEQLSELANQEVAQLMKDLEAELLRNPAMQNELSEITKNSLKDAENSLKDSAEKDNQIQKMNERSDAELQKQKTEIADGLRELGDEAARLSRELVAQANAAASDSKSDETRKHLTETQNQLNQAASRASKANPNELHSQLEEIASDVKSAIDAANEELKKGKSKATATKSNDAFKESQARAKQKKNSEQARSRFRQQEKNTAQQIVRQYEGKKRQTDGHVRNAQTRVRQLKASLKRAEGHLKKTPTDATRQRIVADEKRKIVDAEKKLKDATAVQNSAQKTVEQQRAIAKQIAAKPNPALNAKNPAAELAEQFAGEALDVAEKLKSKANSLAKKVGIEKEIKPSQGQLANAASQQNDITNNTNQTAEDIARAARHERRLQNSTAESALKKVASDVQKVADNESTTAEKQLLNAKESQAVPESKNGDSDAVAKGKENKSPKNLATKPPVSKAQASVAAAEKAFTNEASKLSQTLDTLTDEADSEAQSNSDAQPDAADASSDNSTPQGNSQQSNNQSAQNQSAGQPSQAGQQQNASGQTASSKGASNQASTQSNAAGQTPEERAVGKQLAQTLDELDRLMSAANSAQQNQNSQQAGDPSATPRSLSSIAQSLQSQQASMANSRSAASSQAASAMQSELRPSSSRNLAQSQSQNGDGFDAQSDASANAGSNGEFEIKSVNRNGDSDWGKLRNKSVDGAAAANSSSVSQEYRKKVEAYFKVLADRAKKQ